MFLSQKPKTNFNNIYLLRNQLFKLSKLLKNLDNIIVSVMRHILYGMKKVKNSKRVKTPSALYFGQNRIKKKTNLSKLAAKNTKPSW